MAPALDSSAKRSAPGRKPLADQLAGLRLKDGAPEHGSVDVDGGAVYAHPTPRPLESGPAPPNTRPRRIQPAYKVRPRSSRPPRPLTQGPSMSVLTAGLVTFGVPHYVHGTVLESVIAHKCRATASSNSLPRDSIASRYRST